MIDSTSVSISDQISQLESKAQSNFNQAAICHKHRLAEPEVRFTDLALQALAEATRLRKVLAQRQAGQKKTSPAFVAKCLAVQPLAHSVLEAVGRD